MPSRILRESIVTSESVASLQPDEQDRLPRYFLLADDFGCFIASPPIIRGHIYPLRPDVSDQRIEGDLRAYAGAGIIQLYTGPDTRRYGYFPNWTAHQRPPRPTSKRKHPKPPKPSDPDFAANAGKPPPETSPASPANAGKILPYAQSQSFDRSRLDPQAQSPAKREEPARPSLSPWDPEVLHALKDHLGKQNDDEDWKNFLEQTGKMARTRDERAAAAKKFIAEGLADRVDSPLAYLRTMIRDRAGQRPSRGNGDHREQDAGGRVVPGYEESQRYLQEQRELTERVKAQREKNGGKIPAVARKAAEKLGIRPRNGAHKS
jgi:hypothetical protein